MRYLLYAGGKVLLYLGLLTITGCRQRAGIKTRAANIHEGPRQEAAKQVYAGDKDTLQHRLTEQGVNAMLAAFHLSVLFDTKADLDNDGVPDRIVILNDPHERDEGLAYEAAKRPARPLFIFRGNRDSTYKIALVSEQAIPRYYCLVTGAPETVLANITAAKGRFAFSYSNTANFYYDFAFRYDPIYKTWMLKQVRVKFATFADSRNFIDVRDVSVTTEKFGEISLESFNADKFSPVEYIR